MNRCSLFTMPILIVGLMQVGINGVILAEEVNSDLSAARQTDPVGLVQQEWTPELPSVVVEAERDAVDPVLIRSDSGALVLAAESRGNDFSSVLLARSADGGRTWDSPREIASAARGNRITAGAAGLLPNGRLILAVHEWQDMLPSSYAGSSPLYHYSLDLTSAPAARQKKRDILGKVKWVNEKPRGVHHYVWTGFRRASALKLLLSDDDGTNWSAATSHMNNGPIAASGMGRVFSDNNMLWLAVYGPADKKEMDAALSSVGLLSSKDGGDTWHFSHWVVRADKKNGIGYGPGELVVLPDGQWLGMLEADYRGLGDYTRPRICRTLSSDGGRTWTQPAATLLGPKPSLVLLDRDQLMVGTRQDRGVIFNVMLNSGADLLYQDHLWACIGYQAGDRDGLQLLKLDRDTILAAYHWHGKTDSTGPSVERSKIHTQVLRRGDGFRVESPQPVGPADRKRRWVMAEAYQVSDTSEAPSGIAHSSLLRIRSGDWMAIGFGQTNTGKEGSYGFTVNDYVVLRSRTLEGPWSNVGLVPVPKGAAGDPGTGSDYPGVMIQTRSGRLLLPFSRGKYGSPEAEIELLYSDDEGITWTSLGYCGKQLGLAGPITAGRIVERGDGSLLWPLMDIHKSLLVYSVSTDNGATWNIATPWAKGRNETALTITDGGQWLGVYRLDGWGLPGKEDAWNGPLGMPRMMLTRSEDGGKMWKPSLGFLGCEPDMAILSDGTVLVAYREDSVASAWLSYDEGRTWQLQLDPAELPWPRDATAESLGQWPPGGVPVIRVLDKDTAVVICDTGLIPAGKPLPSGHVLTKELHGRALVRFFRRVPEAEGRAAPKRETQERLTPTDARRNLPEQKRSVITPTFLDRGEGTAVPKKVYSLATPSGIRFAVLGEKPVVPAPTLFVFAREATETLTLRDFNRAGQILAQSGYLCVSLDVPCHGENLQSGEPEGLDGWRKRVENGVPLLEDFLAKSSAVLDHLVNEGYTNPRRVAVCGNSRGGFVALHFAAAEARVRCVAAMAPVTTLSPLREFKGLENHVATRALAVINVADKLAGRPVWMWIGNADDRVNTDDAIALTRKLVKSAHSPKTAVQVELHVMPALGHSFPATAHDEVAAWVQKQMKDID